MAPKKPQTPKPTQTRTPAIVAKSRYTDAPRAAAADLPTRDLAVAAVKEGANLRTTFDGDALQLLARSIRENGLLSPVIARDNGDGTYTLVGGARRFRAVRDILKGATIAARVIPPDADPTAAAEIGIHDNFRRVEVSWPDRIRFVLASRKNATPNRTIAEWLGLSEQATSNDYAVGTKLLPEIFAAWESHPGATQNFALSTYNLPAEEQRAAWAAFIADKPIPADGKKGKRGRKGKGKDKPGAGGTRRGAKELDGLYAELAFLEGVAQAGPLRDWTRGALWALQYAAGVPGCTVPASVTDAVAKFRAAADRQPSLFGRKGKDQPDAVGGPDGGAE